MKKLLGWVLIEKDRLDNVYEESERRRRSIDYLIRWKSAAIKELTDNQLDHIARMVR